MKKQQKTKHKVVKYKVTGLFGNSPVGEIRDAILLLEQDGSALLYHPRDKGMTASIEFCVKNNKELWITASKEFGFVNIDCQRNLTTLLQGLKKITY